ncbi:AraC family transcriptional regulator [Membranicola marinus]|uniref:AraC family transcriptional regulator n=1 Tax=Membranihabitans marinus TaxID=1227546 RepID=A0A953LBN5_9BACT|nr:AraC family transcriptional regulator [Membranihabitans marinus]MBY5959953.1 AraC family transcriptional regulator [Membranihabitans marinus]
MKPILRKVDSNAEHSFSVRENIYPFLYNYWHYHPEIELTYIRKSSGTRLAGDSIERFTDGDLILLGSNLPHMWRNDDIYFDQNSDQHIESIAIHFKQDFWGKEFLAIPEHQHIQKLLNAATRGFQIHGKTHDTIVNKMEEILHLHKAQRVIHLLDMLDIIAQSNELNYLASQGFVDQYKIDPNDKINEIYQYTLSNFKNGITIQDVAKHVHISPNYFCRYFKKRTSKTYIEFVTELRVGYACKLLLENNLNINQICYESGFNNVSNFNRKFKEITKQSPSQYYRAYSEKNQNPHLHPNVVADLQQD